MRWLILLAIATAYGQQLKTEQVHGRRAWVLENGRIRVAVLAGGGHIAEVRLVTGSANRDVNPMRVPHYPTIEPYQYSDAAHNATYGSDPHRWLSSGYMGHLLCFPFYGPPSSEGEVAAGLGNHGEAPVVEWKKAEGDVTAGVVRLRVTAELLKTNWRVERLFTLHPDRTEVTVEEWVENLLGFDRPVNWMQHATFGPPFVEPGKTVLRLSAVKGQAGDKVIEGKDVRERVMPATRPGGSYTALLMDAARPHQFFTLTHPSYPVTIGYVYPTAGNLWIGDWMENQRNTNLPWSGKVIARGIEFGSTPYAEGLRKSIERGSLFGVPAFRWIGAKERAKTEFTIFLTEKLVRDARWENGRVVLD